MMAYNELLVRRVRLALARLAGVEEKRMFSGITFMLNGKMCISVSGEELMCRIDPALHDEVVHKPGCRSMMMRGREYKGFVLIGEEGFKNQGDFQFWIDLAVSFNKKAKSAPKLRKRVHQ